MSLPSQALPLPTAFYDKNSGGYWYQDSKNAWVRFQQNDFVRFLKSFGYSSKVAEGETQSAVDRALMNIQMSQNVDYAGPLAGYSQGLVEDMEGMSVLVTGSPKIIQPEPGEYAVIHALLTGMFGEEQLPYFLSWSQLAYGSMRSGNRRPGQAVVLAGPVNSGKSLVQQLVTKMIGGRTAHPYLYMNGGTAFNSELFGAEHLVIDDELGQSDFRARQKLTASFKMITSAGSQQCHPKGKPAVTLRPFWRLTVSVNDEPESLLVLPLLKNDLADKIMIFRVGHQTMPMPTRTNEEREAFWNQLMTEFPHWLDFLINQWRIPTELQEDRFGVRAFHHPEIVETIDSLSPEMKLYNLLEAQFGNYNHAWTGTATQLETLLSGDQGGSRHEARKLFSYNTACAVYLKRLADKYPIIVNRAPRQNNLHLWRIDFNQIRFLPVCPPTINIVNSQMALPPNPMRLAGVPGLIRLPSPASITVL